MKHLLIAGSLGCLGGVVAACGSASPTAPTPPPVVASVSQPPALGPTPSPSPPPGLMPGARLSGTVTEMTANGPVPLQGVELYCDACGEVGHTFMTTDEKGAYDFGSGGIWNYAGGAFLLLIKKEGYDVPGGTPMASGWTSRSFKVDGGAIRFDFVLTRK